MGVDPSFVEGDFHARVNDFSDFAAGVGDAKGFAGVTEVDGVDLLPLTGGNLDGFNGAHDFCAGV